MILKIKAGTFLAMQDLIEKQLKLFGTISTKLCSFKLVLFDVLN